MLNGFAVQLARLIPGQSRIPKEFLWQRLFNSAKPWSKPGPLRGICWCDGGRPPWIWLLSRLPVSVQQSQVDVR